MATSWDTTVFPITDQTSVGFHPYTTVDLTTGGAIRHRIMSNSKVGIVRMQIAPLDAFFSAILQTLIFATTPTEWIVTIHGITYTGYIDTGTARLSVSHGNLYHWFFDLVGEFA